MNGIFFVKDQMFDFPPTGFNARLVLRKREGTEIFEDGRKPDVIRILKPPASCVSQLFTVLSRSISNNRHI